MIKYQLLAKYRKDPTYFQLQKWKLIDSPGKHRINETAAE